MRRLLWVVLIGLVFAAPLWLISSRIKTWQALLGGFVLANLFIVGLIVGGAFISMAWVAGLLWFLLKTYVLVFTFVWMRGTLPRVRIDQLMNFAWKWLMELAFINIFITAGAIILIETLTGNAP